MKKNGFTLIELLAVIVILAIIMIIATTQVNKQIKKTKVEANNINKKEIKKAAETCLIMSGDEGCSSVNFLIKNGYLEKFEDPITGEIVDENSVASYCYEIKNENNKITVEYNEKLYDIYKTVYDIGEEICIEEECFKVISDNGTTVNMISKYNLNIQKNKQSLGAQRLMFSENIYWCNVPNDIYREPCILKAEYGEKYPAYIYDNKTLFHNEIEKYVLYLKELGAKSVTSRLLSYDEAVSLGGCVKSSLCKTVPKWLKGQNDIFWLGTADDYGVVWYMDTFGGIFQRTYSNKAYVRPVITISKSDIK